MQQTAFAAISSFIDYLKFEKRYSAHTIRGYEDDLIQCFDFLEKDFGISEPAAINSPMIRSWLASIKEAGMSSRSINRKISSLKSFYKYGIRTGILDSSPVSGLIIPRTSKRLPTFVEEKDISTLFNHVEFGEGWKGLTERLALLLFYHTGMRLSELVNLKESHVNVSHSSLKILGKGNKERVVPVSVEILRQLIDYMDQKRKNFEQFSQEYLLVTEKGKKLYSKYLYLIVHNRLQEVTTLSKKSPHILRHTFATHLMNNGADINSVKDLLGHSSLAATQIYTHNTIEKLKEVYKKAHPRA